MIGLPTYKYRRLSSQTSLFAFQIYTELTPTFQSSVFTFTSSLPPLRFHFFKTLNSFPIMMKMFKKVASFGLNRLRDTLKLVALKRPKPPQELPQELPQDPQLELESEGSSNLKSCLRRGRQGDHTIEERQTDSNDSKGTGAKKAVRFNTDKRVRVFCKYNKICVFEPDEVVDVDGDPSPEWLKRSGQRKVHEKAMGHSSRASGGQSACMVSLRPNKDKSQVQAWDLLGAYRGGPLADGTADVAIIHVSKDELLQKAIEAIDEIAQGFRRLSSPPLTRTRLHLLEMMVTDAKANATLVFQREGAMPPYQAGAGKGPLWVRDAEKDGDYSEVVNKGSAMRHSCPSVATVRSLEGLLRDFTYWAKSTFGRISFPPPPEAESSRQSGDMEALEVEEGRSGL